MNNAKIIYLFALVLVCAVIGLIEESTVSIPLFTDDAETKYIVDLLSIVSGVGGFFLLLYMFRFKSVMQRVARLGEEYVVKVCHARVVLWLVLMLLNVWLYYATTGFGTNPKYAIIFLAIAYLFCWPSMPSVAKTEPPAFYGSRKEEALNTPDELEK